MLNPLSLEKNHTINNLTLLDDNDARNSTSYSNNLSVVGYIKGLIASTEATTKTWDYLPPFAIPVRELKR